MVGMCVGFGEMVVKETAIKQGDKKLKRRGEKKVGFLYSGHG